MKKPSEMTPDEFREEYLLCLCNEGISERLTALIEAALYSEAFERAMVGASREYIQMCNEDTEGEPYDPYMFGHR